MATADDQDRAEALDDDRLAGDFPPDEPLGVDAYGTTGAEEAWDEPLAERVAREEPDVLAPPDANPTLVAPDEGVHEDVERDAVAFDASAGRGLGALDDGDPLAGDDTTRDVVQEREGARPAEEAAVHVVDDDAI